jgi:hypothetical protein
MNPYELKVLSWARANAFAGRWARKNVAVRQLCIPGRMGAKQADIINSLTLGYCPVVAADTSLTTQAQKSAALDGFAERIYTQIVSQGRD